MMNNSVIIEKFWNENHQYKEKSVLSGCLFDETVEFLKIEKYIKKNITVLEVGVGLGYVTKGLFECDAKVSALDISDIALSNVEKYCEKTYNVNEIGTLPSNYYDLIICNNVVQHVPTEILNLELKEIMRSLKTGGVFAVEFISSNSFVDNGVSPNLEDVKAGRLCRDVDYLTNILNSLGGDCVLVFDKNINISFITGHHVLHVKKINKNN